MNPCSYILLFLPSQKWKIGFLWLCKYFVFTVDYFGHRSEPRSSKHVYAFMNWQGRFMVFFVTECIPVNNRTNGWMFFLLLFWRWFSSIALFPLGGHNTMCVVLEIWWRLVISTYTADFELKCILACVYSAEFRTKYFAGCLSIQFQASTLKICSMSATVWLCRCV